MLPHKSLLTGFFVAVAALLTNPAASAQTYRGPIIDTHAHFRSGESDWTNTPSQPIGVQALALLNARAGVQRTGLVVVAGGGPLVSRARNDAALAAAQADPQRYYVIASVHPADGAAALAELERLSGLGVKQIKLHPNSQEFDVADPAVAAVTQRAGALGMAVLIDCFNPFDRNQFGKILRLALSQPQTRFVLAHMNFTDFRETAVIGLVRRLGGGENIYVDLSVMAPFYADSPLEAELVWTMRQIGMDRVVFGSDWPAVSPVEAVGAVRRLGLSASEQKRVFFDNARALLNEAP